MPSTKKYVQRLISLLNQNLQLGAPNFSHMHGMKYLVSFSSRSLKMREKYISFAQLVYFLREVCLLFNF